MSLGDVQVHLVTTVDEAYEFMRWLSKGHDVLAFDLETSGINPREPGARIRLAQIGDTLDGWAIPWERWGGVFMEALDKFEGQLVGHNAAFDIRWLRVHADWQVPWHRIHDTMIMAQIVDPTKPAGLKPLGDRLIDRRASAGQTMLKEAMANNNWTWDTVPIDFGVYWQYGCIDTILTAHLYHVLKAHELYPRVYELEMATRRVCSQMEDNGMRIDVDYCHEKIDEFDERTQKARAWAQENWGISIGSSSQLIRFFQDTLGQEITRRTKGGSPSMDKEQLAKFAAAQDPMTRSVAEFVLGVRKMEKMSSTYFSNFLEMHEDSVLHPQIRTMGARTGRMSIVSPALQTLTKGDAVIRNAFIPREGEVMISSDYSQIEARLMAHFSNEAKMIETFREADETGGDFFTSITQQIYQDPSITKGDKRRGLTKGVVYGKLYGAGVSKMAITAGVDETQMRSVVDAFDTTYTGVKAFQTEIERVGSQREASEGQGYVITPYGRRLPSDKEKAYTLVNYMLQSHAAELLKDALIRLDNAGLGEYLLVPIHDEVIFSVPREDHVDVMHTIGEVMSITDPQYKVPIPADPEGPLERWGEKYEV